MLKQSVEAEEDVEREEEERVRTYSRAADNYWLCQTTSVMSAFQPSAWRRTSSKAPSSERQTQRQTQEGSDTLCLCESELSARGSQVQIPVCPAAVSLTKTESPQGDHDL